MRCFVKHFEEMREQEEKEEEGPEGTVDISSLEMINLLLACIPLRGQCQEFFAPIVSPILTLLRDIEIIPKAQWW